MHTFGDLCTQPCTHVEVRGGCWVYCSTILYVILLRNGLLSYTKLVTGKPPMCPISMPLPLPTQLMQPIMPYVAAGIQTQVLLLAQQHS